MALSNFQKHTLLLFVIIVLAGFFRFWQIGSIPGGLFPDEAANGLDIVNYIFKGEHSPFFERGLGRESLFFYLQAVSVKIFGIGVWQMHIISALIGILTVIFTWLLAKKIFNARTAFFAGFFMAASSWHVTLSRTGFRAIMVPLFATLFFYLAYSAYKENYLKKRIIFTALAGISLALGFYTYPSFRMVVLIIGVLSFFVLLSNRRSIKIYLKEIVFGLIAFSIVISPLIVYFYQHPDSFAGRAGYVSVFNKDMNKGDLLGTALDTAQKTFLMFFTEGDANWRHNTSGKSMLNPLVSAFFALGFLFCLTGVFAKHHLKYIFLLLWFFLMLVPELLTAESIPHGLRAIGVMPGIFIISALGVNFFYERAKPVLGARLLLLVLALISVFSAGYDFQLYFGISANSPDFYYAYRSDLTTVSNYLNERNLKDKTYLALDAYSVQTPEFLTSDYQQPYIIVDPAASYKTMWKIGDQIVFTQSTIYDTTKFTRYHPEAKLIKQEFNRFEQEIMRVYEY